MKTIKTLVVTDRIHTRMQSEIFYAFKSAARKTGKNKKLDFMFFIFNPFMADQISPREFGFAQRSIMKILDEQVVDEIIDIRNNITSEDSLLQVILNVINNDADSPLARIYHELEKIVLDFSFIVIESTAQTVIHPIFYNSTVCAADVGYAKPDDIKDTLYGLFLIDIALKNNIPLYGTCHGAQLAYLYAGGGLKRLFQSYDVDQIPERSFYPRNNPYGGPDEIWQIGRMLNTRNINNHRQLSLIKYPLPPLFNNGTDNVEGKFINRDFNHTLAMTTPIPDEIEVLLYHPLSIQPGARDEFEIEDVFSKYPEITKDSIDKFKSAIGQSVIVDVFKYKSILAFQHHPHYTYDDENTSEIFDYLINFIYENTLTDK